MGAQLFAGGDGGLGTVRLQGGRAVWNMAHLTVPEARRLHRADRALLRRRPARAGLPLALAEPPADPAASSAGPTGMVLQTTETRVRLRGGLHPRAGGLLVERRRGRARCATASSRRVATSAALRAGGHTRPEAAPDAGGHRRQRRHRPHSRPADPRSGRRGRGRLRPHPGRRAPRSAAGTPFDDLAAMLATVRPEVVHVCTPNHLHAEQSIAAFAAGAHVLCEKPLATNERRRAADDRGRCRRRSGRRGRLLLSRLSAAAGAPSRRRRRPLRPAAPDRRPLSVPGRVRRRQVPVALHPRHRRRAPTR